MKNIYFGFLFWMFFQVLSINVHGQYFPKNSNATYQVGLSAKVTLEIFKEGVHPKIGLDAGIGAPIINNVFYPSFNLEYEVYHGGLGTMSGSGQHEHFLNQDLIAAVTLTAGTCGKDFNKFSELTISRRNQFLYYFNEMAQPALQNPFNYSISLGTNYIFYLDNQRLKPNFQRIGFLDVHLNFFQFVYYNDGGGFNNKFIKLGDGEDRYFTGGGFFMFSLPTIYKINSFTASYHKYTGWYQQAFDVTNELNLSFVNYKITQQQYFNKSYFNFEVGSSSKGISAFFRFNNSNNRHDFQNNIHYILDDGYHQIPYPNYKSWGVSYFGSYSQTNLK